MTRPTVIGVDPGPIPGIAVIRPDGQPESLQVTAGVLVPVLRALIAAAPVEMTQRPMTRGAIGHPAVLLAVEKFVVGPRAGRSKSPAAGQQTRNMVGALEALAAELGVRCVLRPAADVKTWATCGTPTRVERAGLAPTGMVHARSAGWHALYAAVHDTGLPDPLSRRSGRASSPAQPQDQE